MSNIFPDYHVLVLQITILQLVRHSIVCHSYGPNLIVLLIGQGTFNKKETMPEIANTSHLT